MVETSKALDYSVLIPVYNEVESLPALYEQVTASMNQLNGSFEILFVDDGSTDDSFAVMQALHEQDQRVRVIQFRRNFGKSAALSVGFKEVCGAIIFTMDADLQDDPAEIPKLLAKLNQGYDLVSGWKYPRLDPLSKTLPSRLFNATTAILTGLPLHDFNCGFKAYQREVVEVVALYGELHRYIPVLAHVQGFKVTEEKVKHHPRQFGKSKFGFGRFYKGFFDLLTILFISRYAWRPLHIFGLLGSAIFGAGILINLYMTYLWFVSDNPIGDRPLLMLGILLTVVGVQTLFFGLIAEMIALSRSDNTIYSIRQRL